MMKTTVLTLSFLLSAISLLANGDPVAEFCALSLTKAPVSLHIPEVQIVDEQILFVPLDRYTHIHVTYTLQNNSDQSFSNIAYGFPVDWIGEGTLHWKPDYYTESISQKGWSDDYVRDFSIRLNGRTLKSLCSGDTLLRKGLRLGDERARYRKMSKREQDSVAYHEELLYWLITTDEFPDSELYKEPIYRKWFYAHISIPARRRVTLEVDYTIRNNHRLPLYEVNREFVISSDSGKPTAISAYNTFFYDFSPAAAWGNGKADRISFSILPRYEIDVWGYTLNNNMFTAENFDFLNANPLMFGYSSPLPADSDAANLVNHRLPASAYRITVNGQEGDYATLCDNDLKSSLFLPAGDDGMVNIEITTQQPEFVTGVAIAHGDWRNERSFRHSAKSDSMSVVCRYTADQDGWPRFWFNGSVDLSVSPDFTSRETLLLSMQRFNILGRVFGVGVPNSPFGPEDCMKSLTIQLHAPDGKGISLSEIILTNDAGYK